VDAGLQGCFADDEDQERGCLRHSCPDGDRRVAQINDPDGNAVNLTQPI